MRPTGFLLDLGVARQVLPALQARGYDVSHSLDLGLRDATDAELIAHALERNLVIITTDTGCANVVARSLATAPSVITVRLGNPNAEGQIAALEGLLAKLSLDELESCVVSLERERFRRRSLPPLV